MDLIKLAERFDENISVFSDTYKEIQKSDTNYGHYFYIKMLFEKAINKRIEIDEEIEICSFISIGYLNSDIISENRIPIEVRLNFAWYNKEDKAYPLTLPASAKIIFAPRNIEINKLVNWNSASNEFIDKNGKTEDIKKILNGLIKRHTRPTKKYRGIIERFNRRILWYPVLSIVEIFKKISFSLYELIAGRKIVLNEQQYAFNYLFMLGQKPEYKTIEKIDNKANIYGINTNISSLILYSIINLGIYSFLYLTKNVPVFLESILKSGLLSIFYVVITYSIYQLVLSRPFLWLSDLWLKIIAGINKNKPQKYKK
jgi:hypothetical protein